MFPRLESREWLAGRPPVALYDLATTDVGRDRESGVDVVPGSLEGRPGPPSGASLETLIAGAYGVEPEQVLVTPGATGATLLAAAAAIDRHQEAAAEAAAESDDVEAAPAEPHVLVELPGAEALVRTPEFLGANVDRFRREPEGRLDPERVANAIVEDTCLVTVSNRHDPSGRLTDRETLATVAETAREGDATLLVDEEHAPFGASEEAGGEGTSSGAGAVDGEGTSGRGGAVDGEREANAVGPRGGVTGAGLPGTVVTGSLSCWNGLGALGVGWLVGEREFVARARSIGHHCPDVPEPSRALAMRAFHHAESIGAESRALLAENADALAEFLERRSDLTGHVSPVGPFAFLDHADATGDELAAAAWEEGILVVPGRFFDDSERVRVSLTNPPEEVSAGLDALGEVLDVL